MSTDRKALADLKPCPFCGGEASVTFYDDGGWCVACDALWCAMMDNTYRTEAEAIAAWNRRAAEW